jgi:hypothetical protein
MFKFDIGDTVLDTHTNIQYEIIDRIVDEEYNVYTATDINTGKPLHFYEYELGIIRRRRADATQSS